MYVYSLSLESLDQKILADLVSHLADHHRAHRIVPDTSAVRLVYETPEYVGETVVHKFCVPFEVRLERVADEQHLASPESELRAMAEMSSARDSSGDEADSDCDAQSVGTEVISTCRARPALPNVHKRRRVHAGNDRCNAAAAVKSLCLPLAAAPAGLPASTPGIDVVADNSGRPLAHELLGERDAKTHDQRRLPVRSPPAAAGRNGSKDGDGAHSSCTQSSSSGAAPNCEANATAADGARASACTSSSATSSKAAAVEAGVPVQSNGGQPRRSPHGTWPLPPTAPNSTGDNSQASLQAKHLLQ